jgi:hypothetical protein
MGQRRVIVIRGPVNNQMVLNTATVAPVVIGRASGSEEASVPATAAAAIRVLSGDVLIRDLRVTAGTSPANSKGIVVTGAGTKLRLVHTTISLGTGLGVQADTGAELHMDRCLIQNNSVGGILINGASYDIQNTIIANNGFGVTFSSTDPPQPSQFRFNTVVGNVGNAASCDSTKARTLSASIILGLNAFCALDNSDTTTSTLSSTHHLTAKLLCPNGAPASFPDHDFDGDPRTSPVDCGADQIIP